MINTQLLDKLFAQAAQFARYAQETKDAYHINRECPNFSFGECQELPEDIFASLPQFLREVTRLYLNSRERDIIFLSTLTAVGSCFSMVSGIYDHRRVFPNLYTVINAPPGNGKGVMVDVMLLIKLVIETIGQNFMIPGNTSSAAFLNQLAKNSCSLMLESESDTLTNTVAQDWGGYSDMLRKAFHHEDITKARKGGGENAGDFQLIEARFPKLSLLISGTPDTIKKLIGSSDDGLFSRLLFYSFSEPSTWRSPRSAGNFDRQQRLEALGAQLFEQYQGYSGKTVQFDFTEAQWEAFGTRIESIVKRNGLICFRIAMTLSVLDEPSPGSSIVCNDRNFMTAMTLASSLLKVGYTQFLSLAAQKITDKSPAMELYRNLETDRPYKHKDIEAKAKEVLNVQSRVVYKYTASLASSGLLEKRGQVWFKRIEKAR